MTKRKMAADALRARVIEVLRRKAKEAQEEISTICAEAEAIGSEDYFAVTEFAQVRHHMKFADGSFHNMDGENDDGVLINCQWPKTKPGPT